MYATAIDLLVEAQPVSAATIARKLGVPQADIVSTMQGADPGECQFMADRIVKLRKLRSLLTVGESAVKAALSDPADADAAVMRVEAMLAVEGDTQNEALDMSAGMDAVLAQIDRYIAEPDAVSGLETGWKYFDRVLDGLQKKATTAVYARTGSYKSVFVNNIAWLLGRQGIPGAMFTTEMGNTQVGSRMLQLESGLDFRELRYQREMWRHKDAIHEAAEDLARYPIWRNDRSVLDIAFIRGFLTRLKRTHGIEWAVIDLINHVHSNRFGKENETKNEAFVAQQVKQIAKDVDIHVIFTAHVAKPERGQQGPKKPFIETDDIKGSSAFSQDADTAISLVPVERSEDFSRWVPLDRQGRMTVERSGRPLNLLAAITKSRTGAMADIAFEVDLQHGCRMMPEAYG
jgi:replicative DNA helicase